jgi:hypothetical protein
VRYAYFESKENDMRHSSRTQRTLRVALFSTLLTGLLAACGGGGTTGSAVKGKAIDGYLEGATICLDVNRNGACDSDEPQSVTDSTGSYSFTLPDGFDNADHVFLADVPATAVDSDNPGTTVGKAFVMRTPFNMRSVITPLTTVVSAYVTSGMGVEAAKALAVTDLGLPAGFDFAKDYVADSDVKAHNAAKVVARILQTQPTGTASEITTAITANKAAIQLAATTTSPYTSSDLDDKIGPLASGGPATSEGPTTSATAPTATNVLSVYSDAYTPTANVVLNPSWGQTTVFSEIDVASGDKAVKLAGLNYQGVVLQGANYDQAAKNVSGFAKLHVDVWSSGTGSVDLYLISAGKEVKKVLALTAGWNSFDINLSDFSDGGVNLNAVTQLKWDSQAYGDQTIYYDNLYFWTDVVVAEPTASAPTPRAGLDALSVYSDAYTPTANVVLNPSWGQTTVFSEIDVASGDKAVKLAGLNYQGVVLQGANYDQAAKNVSGFTKLHVDVWSSGTGSVDLYLISEGKEVKKVLDLIVGWNSFDINLSDFSDGGVNLNAVTQLKWDSQAYGDQTIYYDNLYFWRDRPVSSAPAPSASGSVVSIYSDAYTPTANVVLNPSWGQATVFSEIDVASGDKAVKLAGLNYQGVVLQGANYDQAAKNVSGFTKLHVDVWSSGTGSVDLYLISEGKEVKKVLALTAGWNSFDINLSDFAGVNLNAVTQLKWDSQAYGLQTIYYDNLYIY